MTKTTELVHDALFYGTDDEYLDGIREFAREGIDAGESMLIAVPARNIELLRPALAAHNGRIEFVDMQKQGKNPARILPFIQAFIDLHAHQPVRFVGEPIWAGRTAAEIVEGTRHEALINAAFADAPAHILCPYDTRGLDSTVLADARRTHPTILDGDGHRHSCSAYADPLVMYAAEDWPLPEPSVEPVMISFADGLAQFRRDLWKVAGLTGMDRERIATVVLAANEAAANTLIHAGGTGTVRVWHEPSGLVCEIADDGKIADPFAGRRAPTAEQNGGRGLWMMNQLCDLVELRSTGSGTVIRLHMTLR